MVITEMLSKNARVCPDEIALVQTTPSQSMRRQITWREFDLGANKISNLLLSMGIQSNDNVLHMMMNSIEWVVAYIGIIKAGAVVVPLNYRFNTSDIIYCANTAVPKLFILGEEFVERSTAAFSQLFTVRYYLNWAKMPAPSMIDMEKELDRFSSNAPHIQLSEEEPCAIYFTSGTTGPPKAVVLTHRNLNAAAMGSIMNLKLQKRDVFLFLAPMYHSGSFSRWLGFLYLGLKTVILIDKKVTPQYIFETISEEKITHLSLYVPWTLDIVEALDRGELHKQDYDLKSLRYITIGAQYVPLSLTERWNAWFPEVGLHEGFGLTEGGGATGCSLQIPDGVEKKPGMIGKPCFNCEARVVDAQDIDVPVGEVGELVLRGDGVMKEYYKNPEETARVLRNNWLHTGDLAKIDDDGMFYIVGRKKDIIVSGGENVYPSDVEAVLMEHPKVHDAAVIGMPDNRLGEVPLAIVEAKPGKELREEELITFCEMRIPRYRRPRKFVFDKVPRNVTGKIDKSYLQRKFTD